MRQSCSLNLEHFPGTGWSLRMRSIQKICCCLAFGFSCKVCFWNQPTDVCAFSPSALVAFQSHIFMSFPHTAGCRAVTSLPVLLGSLALLMCTLFSYVHDKIIRMADMLFMKLCLYLECDFGYSNLLLISGRIAVLLHTI